MGVEFNPNLMNQIGQNNFGSQKVSFGGLNGGNPFGGSSTKIGGNNSVFAQEIAWPVFPMPPLHHTGHTNANLIY